MNNMYHKSLFKISIIVFYIFIFGGCVNGMLQMPGLPLAKHYITIYTTEKFPFIKWIATKQKKAEGRINSPFFNKLKKDDTIVFYNNKKDYVLCKITYLHRYQDFHEMLSTEGVDNMLPGVKNIDAGEIVYSRFPGAKRVQQFGALAIGLIPLEAKY